MSGEKYKLESQETTIEKLEHNADLTIEALTSIIDNWSKFSSSTNLSVITKLRDKLKEVR